MEGQLLTDTGTGDTDSLDVNSEDFTTNARAVGPPGHDQSASCMGRAVSKCRALSKTWFLKETVMLLRLALPVVSTSQQNVATGLNPISVQFAAVTEWISANPIFSYSVVRRKICI